LRPYSQSAYCVEVDYEDSEENTATVWNVTNAEKVGEALATDGTGEAVQVEPRLTTLAVIS